MCGQGGDASFDVKISAEDIARGQPIIGYSDEERPSLTMKSPKEMTPAQWAEHMITHLPYCPGCPYCTAGKSLTSTTNAQPTHDDFPT